MASAIGISSLSKSMMKPMVTNIPARNIQWMLSTRLRRVFCYLPGKRQGPWTGVCDADEHREDMACRISIISSSSSARLTEASVKNSNG
jgi:hypothetical protein